MTPAGAAAAPPALAADPGLDTSVRPLLRGEPDARARERLRRAPDAAVPAVITAALAGDAVAQGRAAEVLVDLGAAAVPALEQAMQDEEPKARRIAVLALLQLGAAAAPAAPTLAAAAERDPDPAVRAAAQAAWKRAVGDTSDLDRLRAQHDAAVRGSR